MINTLTYKSAVKKIALLENKISLSKSIGAFDRSLLLALLYDVNKEKALDDILKVRQKFLKI